MRDVTLTEIQRLTQLLVSVGQMVLNDTNEVHKSGDHVELIKHFNHTRIAAEKIKEAREVLSELSDKLSREYIPDCFKELRERTGQKPPFVIDGVGRVTVSHRWSASMLDKDQGFDWLRRNDMGSIIQETVNAQTLAAYAKNRFEKEGKDLPTDIFKVGQMAFTSITAKI